MTINEKILETKITIDLNQKATESNINDLKVEKYKLFKLNIEK